MRNLIKDPVQTLFLGTDWESVETLRSLLEDKRFNVTGVVTTPDKPIGRKQILTPSKVKEYAVEKGIQVYHTEKNPDRYKEALEIFKPELIVCKAFGEIVPGFFIQYPKYKAINVHFSILPKYRGAVPIQKAILEGEKETGITIMLMSEGMDEGDILEIFKEPIQLADSNFSLRERLVRRSAGVLGDVLERWINGQITPQKQDGSKATYCWQKDISKENAQILWDDMEPVYIERMARAMIPWPVAWTVWNGRRMKILEAYISQSPNNLQPGTLFSTNDSLYFSTKEKNLVIAIQKLQIEGKKVMTDKEFLAGYGKDLQNA